MRTFVALVLGVVLGAGATMVVIVGPMPDGNREVS
jgi:hypothetical protein